MKSLSGDKVSLRPIELADIQKGWLDWVNDPATADNLSLSRPVTNADLENYYRNSQPPKAAMFAICRNDTSDYVGNARISSIDVDNHRATYGWFIGAVDCRGRGFGTDALRLVVRYAFEELGLNRLSTSIRADNIASLRANERVGFVREGVLREYMFKDGRFYDAVQISILRRDYQESGHALS